MRPGSANWPGPRMVSLRSFEGDFGIFPRSPAQVIWGPSTTIAAFSSTRSPSNRPSTSNTVRIATQYRPAMPGALIERLRACGFVPPDYDGGSLLNVAVTVLDLVGARDETDPPPLRALDPDLRKGVRQVVVVLADGLGTAQLRALCAAGDTPFIASLLARAEAGDDADACAGGRVRRVRATVEHERAAPRSARASALGRHAGICVRVLGRDRLSRTPLRPAVAGARDRGRAVRPRPRARLGRARVRRHPRHAYRRSRPRRDRSR